MCPDLGALRACLDEPPAPEVREHLASCAECRETLAELRRNADLAAPALALLVTAAPPAPEIDRVLARVWLLRRARAAAAPAPPTPAAPAPTPAAPAPPAPAVHAGATESSPVHVPRRRALGTRARAAVIGLAASVALGGVVATPGGRALAAGFLSHFQSRRFQAISITADQATTLSSAVEQLVDTGAFSGDAEAVLDQDVSEATSVAQAGRIAVFDVHPVPAAALPDGVSTRPDHIVARAASTATLTFHRDAALTYTRRGGGAGVDIPDRYDGTRLLVRVPALAIQEFAGPDGLPRVVVGQSTALKVDTQGGASLAELRDLMLSLPGLPADTVRQLRSIDDWTTTLPLPVPADVARSEEVTVDGVPGLGFTQGALHGVLWQRDGRIFGVGGVLSAAEALGVARDLG